MYLLRKGGSCSFLISMSKFRSFPHFAPPPSPTFSFLLCLTQFTFIPLNSLLSIPPPPLSLCVSRFLLQLIPEGWHFHFLSLLFSYSLCLSMLPALSNLSWSYTFFLCVFHCALPLMENGVSLIAHHFDWHARAKPGQQRLHLHAIM